jgi:hypothetical protein
MRKNPPELQRLKEHCHRHLPDLFDFDLDMDAHGHWKLVIKTRNFQQLKGVILALADFLTDDQEPLPATKLNLAFGTPERR